MNRIGELIAEAITSVAPAKLIELLDKWKPQKDFDPDDADDVWHVAQAMTLAGQLLMYTPSLSGVCPIDRFARERRADADAESRAALDSLSRAEFHLLRLASRASETTLLADDLASGERVTLLDSGLPDHALLLDVAVWLAPLPSGAFVAAGHVLPLDAAAREEGMSFVRPGKGLGNPRRCAAAVYRHVARHGGPLIEGLNTLPDDELDDEVDLDDLVEGPKDPFGLLAEDFAQDGDASAEAIREARSYASLSYLVEAMGRSVVMRRLGRKELSEAYARMAYLIVETLDCRIAAGYEKDFRSLADVGKLVDRSVAEAGAPDDIRAMFEDMRRRATAARGARANDAAEDKELARVLQLIRALRAKTVEQGCSEQEALASAKKVAELLDRYGLSLGEVELREQSCAHLSLDTGRKRRAPIDECVPAVAAFCDCRCWSESAADGALRYVFFGLPADVEAAHCIYDLIILALKTETAAFKKRGGDAPKTPAKSFQIGFAHGVACKLHDMKTERDAANRASGGRELVPIKESLVEDEIEKLGLSFRDKHLRRHRVEVVSYEAGVAAGHKFEPHRSVESE